MPKSNAQHGTFLFAQNTDNGKCHLSFNGTGTHFNVQITMEDVSRMINNLLRVQEADIYRLICENVSLKERIDNISFEADTRD